MGMPDIGKVFSSAYLPATMIAFGSGLKAFGLLNQGKAAVEAAKRREQAAEFAAQQIEINAGQAKAASQRDAYFQGLQADQLISAIRARAGAGASDPGVLSIIANATARKAYNMQAALYGGEEKSRTMLMDAAGKRYDAALGIADAKATKKASGMAALGVLAEGGASIYQKYWPKDADLNQSTGTVPGRGYDFEFNP